MARRRPCCASRWRTADDWPLPGTAYRPYYLHSGGWANTLHGDGTLSAAPPGDEPPDVYLANPLRPVPTVGGQVLLPGANAVGPRDQRARYRTSLTAPEPLGERPESGCLPRR